MSNPKVSVIIPIYNVEPYIEKCVRSLFNQTLDEIEYIFVNDCTPDNSMEILQNVLREFPLRKPYVKIIRHNQNRGIASTRNSGLNAAAGEYVIHCDSDDWVEHTMYEDMYLRASEGNFDIVWCDFSIVTEKTIKYRSNKFIEDPEKCINALLTGIEIKPVLWNKLIKLSILRKNNLRFPDGINIREDTVIVIKCFYYSKKVCYIEKSLYNYRIHNSSISGTSIATYDKEVLIKYRLDAMMLIFKFLSQENKEIAFIEAISISKLKLKLYILRNVGKRKKWLGLFPESKQYINHFPGSVFIKLALRSAALNSIIGFSFWYFINKAIYKILFTLRRFRF